jgi:thiamine biosynthesis lipoprotein
MEAINRRTLLKSAGVMGLVLAGAGLGPTLWTRDKELVRQSRLLMGTIADIRVLHDDKPSAEVAVRAAFEEIARLQRLLSRYEETSDIGRSNRLAFQRDVSVSPETVEVLQRGLTWAERTTGRFDPAIGSISKVWDVRNRKELPATESYASLANQQFFRQVELRTTTNGGTVRFHDERVQLDLGGIGKGYAADQAAAVLRAHGISQALINLGGDLVAVGSKAEGQAWRIGLKDPNDPSKMARVLELSDEALATSGNYEQFFRGADQQIYHHLMDPTLARPARTKFHSFTVFAPTGCDADALATGLFGVDETTSKSLVSATSAQIKLLHLS